MYWISFKVEGDYQQIENDESDDKGDNDDKGDADNSGKDEDNCGNRMDTDKAQTPKQRPSRGGQDKGSSSGTKDNRGHRTVPMWTSLFKDNNMESMLLGEMSNFNGFNLLRDMELAASDDEENSSEEDKIMETLPDTLVSRWKHIKMEEGESSQSGGITKRLTLTYLRTGTI